MKIENLVIGGMAGYVQAGAASRFAGPDRDGWMTSTLMSGDRWQPGGNSSDDRQHSERTEFRSLTEDLVGTGEIFLYDFDLDIPVDYPELSPKQVLAQGHEGRYPVWFLRYEQGDLEFVTNYKSSLNFRAPIPHRKGRPLRLQLSFDYTPGENKGAFGVLADGVKIAAREGHSLVEEGAKSIYFKCGIYRSGMDIYTGPQPAPTQRVRHRIRARKVSKDRFAHSLVLHPVVARTQPVPAPIHPTPTPPVQPSASGDLYGRIAGLQRELDALGKDVSARYQVSDWVGQAGEKLGKLGEQMRRLDARKGKAA